MEAARARAVLKTLESQTYVCCDPSALKNLTSELKRLQQDFDQALPKDCQGLVVPDVKMSQLYERQKILRKLTAARHAVQKAKQGKVAVVRALPRPNKRGRANVLSRLRCRVGQSGEKEREKLAATIATEKKAKAGSGEELR